MSQGLGEILLPPMGIMLMDSVPPATMTSACPEMMRSAAMAMACNPEEQKRLMVMAEASTGRPARREAMRATFMPCSASGMAQPRMTSSISLGLRRGTRATAARMAMAARSSGRVERSVPLKALPTAVRTELTITASRIFVYLESYEQSQVCPYWMLWRNKMQLWEFALAYRRLVSRDDESPFTNEEAVCGREELRLPTRRNRRRARRRVRKTRR